MAENINCFENIYSKFSNKKYNIGFNSACSAAYLLYQYIYETHGSCRVYTTSIGFVSPVFAAIKNNHEVIYVDVNDNLLMSIDDLSNKFIRDGKKSIVMPVLYGGVSSIDGMESLCKDLDCTLVLDSAHCVRPAMGYDYAFFSFHPVKPICMSNGGLLATNCRLSDNYMRSGRNFGRRADGDTYDLVQSGFNFYMNNLNASLGLSQISRCHDNIEKRKLNFCRLKSLLPEELGTFTEHDEGSSYYLSTLVLKQKYSSVILREYLAEKNIQASFHYPFLHRTTFYRKESDLPTTDSLENRIINLPIHQELTKGQIEKIANECFHYSRSRRQS